MEENIRFYNNVTDPIYYCSKCSNIFKYKGIKKYPRCSRCNSTTSLHTYERGIDLREKFEKFYACCNKCKHIWFMKKEKYNKKTQCPNCHFHSVGKRFYWFFKHEIEMKNSFEEFKRIVRSRFPMKRDLYYFVNNPNGSREKKYI